MAQASLAHASSFDVQPNRPPGPPSPAERQRVHIAITPHTAPGRLNSLGSDAELVYASTASTSSSPTALSMSVLFASPM